MYISLQCKDDVHLSAVLSYTAHVSIGHTSLCIVSRVFTSLQCKLQCTVYIALQCKMWCTSLFSVFSVVYLSLV